MNLLRNYQIEELKKERENIVGCSEAYKEIFNGEPFYENWDSYSAYREIDNYLKEEALILTAKDRKQIIGFLVAINGVPKNQEEYVQFIEKIKFIEEIGVLKEYRKRGIASEMLKILLMNSNDCNYIGYRTNAMRYFEQNDKESFESIAIRIQKEDLEKRLKGETIYIPKLSKSEEQDFINKYIELIKYNPNLDVSNSNRLFRSFFGKLEFSNKDGNYTYQKDPTGVGNDRIFPYVKIKKRETNLPLFNGVR